ncbi:MAG TPA: MoxR family ATPase [Candidatus Paceibacterota bacterium]|nr:MoxR family ATPase [Verrucomicrobiota bacterium]HRY46887.1 MoxR family ATPase [Candidatus Paceibacterota bacterium]HSA01154.1 MoxR family ATPase [Candidatus Paceibacterota bacterium]
MTSELSRHALAASSIASGASGTPVAASTEVRQLIQNISRAFLGKEEVVQRAVLALIAGGHVLIEDVPGLGKTLLAKAISRSLAADFKRIQFTADLLPSDITGVTVYSPERHEFSFRRGPVFTNVLLGDEINRATPRTQSSLLEAMEERHVTVDGVVHVMESPFFVLATQNPIELEGTYPLPFAQMDRFMIRLSVGYLDRTAEIQMLREQQKRDPLECVAPVMDCYALTRLQALVREVRLEDSLAGYLVDLVQATRKTDSLEYGASPRGSLDIQSFSQALALLTGREYVLPDDIKQAARLVLPHRLIYRKGGRSATLSAHAVIDHIVDSVPVPV